MIRYEYLAIITVAFVLLTAAVCILYIREMPGLKREARRRLREERSTIFIDPAEIDQCCDVCFGDLDERLFVRECACSKVFHEECADIIGSCPYCGSGTASAGRRRVRRMKCPRCGREMTSSICRCGIVIPRTDGTFDCTCGNRMHMGADSCPVCGTRFRPDKIKINGGSDYHPWSSKP